jgi:hypothetical protein
MLEPGSGMALVWVPGCGATWPKRTGQVQAHLLRQIPCTGSR